MTVPSPAGVDAGLPRQYIRCCLALLVAEAPAHGYQLMESIAQLGINCSDPGFVYRTLRTMEAEAHLVSSWEPSAAGPARRSYQLTDAGSVWLHQSASSLAGTHGCLAAYLDRHQRLTGADQRSSTPSVRVTPCSP